MQKYRYLIQELKEWIDKDDLLSLQQFVNEIDIQDDSMPWDYIYQKAYLHACLKKKKEIKEWFETLFPMFNFLTQSGLKHTFSYGNYLFQSK